MRVGNTNLSDKVSITGHKDTYYLRARMNVVKWVCVDNTSAELTGLCLKKTPSSNGRRSPGLVRLCLSQLAPVHSHLTETCPADGPLSMLWLLTE